MPENLMRNRVTAPAMGAVDGLSADGRPSGGPVTDAPRYAPYRNGKFALSMGMMALDPKDWIDADANRAVELAEKERLLSACPDIVFAALPESMEAQQEVLDLLLENLERYHPGLVTLTEGHATIHETGRTWRLADFRERALDLAGRLVQEDFCLMRPPASPPDADEGSAEAGYVLEAASLCFPARWKMAEKLGQPMLCIHEHVAGYEGKLGRPVDRFFGHLKAARPVQRLNWSVVDDPALFQIGGKFCTGENENTGITPENAGARLWLRVERQTLRRLPRTGRIIFTIRTFVDPLSALEGRTDLAAGLKSALAEMPEDMRLYKSLPPFLEALNGYLARIAGVQP